MSKAGWLHGATVDPETREVRYLSPSSLQLADYSTSKGCLRKWWYAYVKGIKEPSTWQQQAGTNDHANVEKYLETGKRVFNPRVAKGIHMLPPPGPHLQIEHDMVPIIWECKDPHEGEHRETCKKKSGLHLAKLRAAGIPIVGRIDLMHDLGVNYGSDSPEDTEDPPGTVEVFDHKFTKDLRYALKGPELAKTIQMVAYGEYVFLTVPGVTNVRLSHGYYPTNGNARKSTVRVSREPLTRYWTEHVEPLARSIADAAKETNPDNVKPNTDACKAFGRACIHAEYCSAGMDKGLGAHVSTAAQSFLDGLKKPKDPNMALIPGSSLLAHIQKPANPEALAKLKAEEAAAKKKAFVPEGFDKTLTAIEAYGKGMPQITGDAARAYSAFKEYDHAPQGYAGTGDLSNVIINEVSQFTTLVTELAEAFGPPPPEVAPVASVGLMPDDAPVLGAQETPPPPVNPMAQIQVEADKPKATRKPRASKAEKQVDTPVDTPVETPVDDRQALLDAEQKRPEYGTPAYDGGPNAVRDTRVNLLVDVCIEGTKFNDFAVVIDTLTDEMAKKCNLDDVRTAPAKDPSGKDHPLAFGKWKGVLTAAITTVEIPPGTYYIDARGNEIYEEAVQALRKVVKKTGGFYARGAR